MTSHPQLTGNTPRMRKKGRKMVAVVEGPCTWEVFSGKRYTVGIIPSPQASHFGSMLLTKEKPLKFQIGFDWA